MMDYFETILDAIKGTIPYLIANKGLDPITALFGIPFLIVIMRRTQILFSSYFQTGSGECLILLGSLGAHDNTTADMIAWYCREILRSPGCSYLSSDGNQVSFYSIARTLEILYSDSNLKISLRTEKNQQFLSLHGKSSTYIDDFIREVSHLHAKAHRD